MSTLILLRVFWDLKKTFKSRKAPRTFLRPLRRPCLENPKGSHWSCLPTKSCAMRAMCAIRMSRASGTSYVFFVSCHLPVSKVSLGFLTVYWLFCLSRYLESLQNNCRIVERWTQICGWSIISEGLQIWPRFRYPWTAPETRQIWNIGLLDLLGLCLPKTRNSLEISESFMVFGKFRNPKLNNLEVISGQCWKSVNQEFLSNIYFARKPLWTSSAVAEKTLKKPIPLSHWWHWQRLVVWDGDMFTTKLLDIGTAWVEPVTSQAYQVKWPSKGGVINPCTSRYEKCENLLGKYAR